MVANRRRIFRGTTCMKNVTRRSFVSSAGAGVTALGLFGNASHAAEAQLVWKASEWKLGEFHKIIRDPAKVKQVYDVVPISEGKFLSNMKNSLNGLRFGFGIPKEQIKLVGALHGPANMLNYDDYAWNKYRIGEWLNVIDPATGKPAVRNIFYRSKNSPEKLLASIDPDDENSLYQDWSMQALQSRGVQFLSCHTALEEQARVLSGRDKLSQSPEDIVEDMLAHTQPGILVVAAMTAALALLQAQGHYSYISV
jgi:hypothetical protein